MVKLHGTFKGGVVVPDDGKGLPDGTRVTFEAGEPGELVAAPLAEFLKVCAGTIEGPEDLAANHDHYAHGAPKGADQE